MHGFFSKKETDSNERVNGKVRTCYSCGLYKGIITPKMKPFGNFRLGIMNIGEAPGETEDEKGKQWQGRTGQLLKRTYAKFGIDLFEDCININAVNCRPIDKDGKNRIPTNNEIEGCRNSIFNYIKQYRPKIIVLFGNSAIYSLLAHRWKKDLKGIFEWRGWRIPDQELGCWICPTFHPSFVERTSTKEITKIWEFDIGNIAKLIGSVFPIYNEPNIHYLKSIFDLPEIPNGSAICIDYEATGIKPHDKGHRIICVAIATSEDESYVFEMPKNKDEREPFISILRNKNIYKIAQNMKYEETWSLVRLGTRVKGWMWDTMIATHILDNRSGITGLKFQTYVRFGIIDYSSHLDKWLVAVDDKNANSLNRLTEFVSSESNKKELMKYCALDTVHTYRLASLQLRIFDNE